jgi:hypothetical protein
VDRLEIGVVDRPRFDQWVTRLSNGSSDRFTTGRQFGADDSNPNPYLAIGNMQSMIGGEDHRHPSWRRVRVGQASAISRRNRFQSEDLVLQRMSVTI